MRLAILERMNKECTNVKLKLPRSTLNTCIGLNMLLNANNLPWEGGSESLGSNIY